MERSEPTVSISFDSAGGRPIGWQVQQRVDYVVNRVVRTHRGQPAEPVVRALRDQLRSIGVVPNERQIQQYAVVISQLPDLPTPAHG